ncbi:MAG: BrnT family toxin [Bdellovibrionales bacterium]|nr:BrnT family toxin [Bdellovibrionales bacterium]
MEISISVWHNPIVEFEWDLAKEETNIEKHGRTFTEAVECFQDPDGVQLVDEKHSAHEKRFYWVGRANSGDILTVRFTRRGSKVRIIGCAEWRKLRSFYYEAAKNK